MGFMATAAGAVAAAGALAGLTRQHGRTEKTMARLATVSGATDQEMEKLWDTAMTLGKELPIAMSDATSAMEQLAFAGFEAEEAVSAAAGVADIAVASNMNMAQSARTTASALRMFGLEADQTVQVTAAMASTFSNSATTIQELSSALEYVGATATSAGVSLQEMSAAIGVLADRGIRASKAGTALNTTLQRIITGSGKAEEALSRLNLSVEDLTDSSGEVKNLGTVLGMLNEQMQGLESDAERMQVATELAGRRGARALLPLIESQEALNEKMGDTFRSEIRASVGELARLSQEELGAVEEALGGIEIDRQNFAPDDLVQSLEELRESGVAVEEMASRLAAALGISQKAATSLAEDVHDSSVSAEQLAESIGGATTASEIAASQMDTTAGAVEFLKSSFDAMTFTIFTGAAPAIELFNEKLAQGINVLNENETAMKAVGGTLAALTGALTILAGTLGAAWVQASLIPAIMGVVKGSFLAGVVGAGSLTAALSTLASAAASILAPLLAIVAVIGVLVAAFMMVKKAIDENFLGIGEDFAVIMERINSVVSFLKPTIEPLVGILVELGKIFLAINAVPLVASILAIIHGLRLWIDVIDWTIAAITGLINGTRTLKGVLSEAATLIVERMANIGDVIIGAISSIDWAGIGWAVVEGIAYGIGAAFGLFIKSVLVYGNFLVWFWTTVPGMFLDAVLALPGLIAGAFVAGIGLFVDAVVAYGEFLVWYWTNVPGMIVDVVTSIPGFIADKFLEALPTIKRVGGRIVSALMSGLAASAPNVAKGIRKVVQVIRDFLPFSNAKRGPLSSIMSVGGKIVSAIASGLKNSAGKVASAAGDVAGAIKGKLDDVVSGAKEKGAALASTVADGAKSAGGKVKDAVTDVADKAGSVLPMSNAEEGPFSNLIERGQKLVSTVAKGVEGEDSTLQDTLAGVAEGTPLGQAASTLVGAIGVSGGPAAALGGGPAAGGSGRIQIVLEQTNEFGNASDREEIRQMVREATRNGGEDALAELELLLKQTLSEA
jgi:TP901 family phage tail tape measure protein